jgi:hypothetical protein
MYIGKIVKSTSHTDYVCQVYGTNEVASPPSCEDYAFGTFVKASLPDNHQSLVGIIYDTVLVNPDFGRLGPRLSPESELAVFSPDYLNEKVILVGVVAVGTIDTDGKSVQGVPPLALNTDTRVAPMDDNEIRRFHLGSAELNLGYAPMLLAQGAPLTPHLSREVTLQLKQLLPKQGALLSVIANDLAWKSQIMPLGGVQ